MQGARYRIRRPKCCSRYEAADNVFVQTDYCLSLQRMGRHSIGGPIRV